MRREPLIPRGTIALTLLIAAIFFWSLPTMLSSAEATLEEADLPDANLVFITIPTDTIYGVDTSTFWTSFDRTQDLQWIHAFAPTVSGGDSAKIKAVNCYLTNDTGVYASRSWYLFSVIANGIPSDTSITFTIPMARGIKFIMTSTADQDTTYVGGFYIYR